MHVCSNHHKDMFKRELHYYNHSTFICLIFLPIGSKLSLFFESLRYKIIEGKDGLSWLVRKLQHFCWSESLWPLIGLRICCKNEFTLSCSLLCGNPKCCTFYSVIYTVLTDIAGLHNISVILWYRKKSSLLLYVRKNGWL